ncbi:major facilitator superfamily domain-containing protein [Mycena epipterygia]|nr:major facilitator superfamily domain-containing protein [Mycena epipterygia]
MRQQDAPRKLRNKAAEDHTEHAANGDARGKGREGNGARAGGRDEEYIKVSEEDNRRILRKTDIHLLSVYWLQIQDKSVLGYATTFGLMIDAAWIPFSSYLLIRVPPHILMSLICSCWGIALCGMAASTTYPALAACRFLLGLFEATCLPLFACLTSLWYRRAEQPLRICVWYGTDGLGTIMASAFAYGFGNIEMTVCTGPIVYWRLSNSVSEARFLSPEDCKKAVERVRANNTGTKATDKQAVLEPKTWLFFAMALCVNFGASVTLTFGPLILTGIGFDKFRTSLLNTPFGGFQIAIFFASYAAYRFKMKSLVMALHHPNEGGLPVWYYLLAFLHDVNPLIVSWISANTAGSMKKSVVLAGYNAASSVGNIVGPLLFRDTGTPLYRHGLLSCIGVFAALASSILIASGKPAVLRDASMDNRFRQRAQSQLDREKLEAASTGVALGDNALLDLTDWHNDEYFRQGKQKYRNDKSHWESRCKACIAQRVRELKQADEADVAAGVRDYTRSAEDLDTEGAWCDLRALMTA